MSRFFWVLIAPLLLWSFQFDDTKSYSLKKDQVAKISVTKRSNRDRQQLLFRWTLYSDKRLVLLVKYDNFPTQYLLQRDYKRNSIRIYLRDDYQHSYKRAYLVLRFADFDEKKEEAKIEAFVYDPDKVLEVKFE